LKKGIFSRMFILYAVVFAASIIVTEIYITSVVRKNYIEGLKESLFIQATLIGDGIPFKAETDTDGLAVRLKGKTGARVTVILPYGRVMGDSDKESSLMENHLGRPEIQEAVFSGAGSSIRHSETLKYDHLYAAIKIEDKGFVRLAVPLEEVNKAVNRLRAKLLFVVIFVLSALGLVSATQTARLRKLTRRIIDFSSELAAGDLGKRLIFEGTPYVEFDEIARNLNLMAEAMKGTLRESEEEKNRLNAILKGIPDALLIIDPKDIIALSSSASRDFFGASPVTGKPFIEVVKSPEFISMMDRARQDILPSEGEIKLDYPEERNVTVRVSPLFYKERLSGFVAVFHDITRLKKLEEVRKDFVANVSHEIKTPVAAIRGFADTLIEGAIDDRETALRFIRTIKSNSERLNSLVDDLMTISRLELGAIRIEKSPVDIGDVIEDIPAMFKDNAGKKGLYIKTSVKPGGIISADKDRLIQILTNLVDNAIKFTEEGGVTVGFQEEEGAAFLFVEDTGMGIPKRHLPRIGERFYRVDTSRSRKLGGTGLGLAIVKHIVKAHGWRMEMESREGKGTKVKVFVS